VGEVSKTLTLLEWLNAGSERLAGGYNSLDFYGKLQLADATCAGHSFGALTAITVGDKDTRFVRTLTFDPWLFASADDAVSLTFTRTPLCVINSEKWNPGWRTPTPGLNDARMDMICDLRQEAGVPTFYAEVIGTRHEFVSDLPYVIEGIMYLFSWCRSKVVRLSAREVHDVIAKLATSFLAKGDFAKTAKELSDHVNVRKQSFKGDESVAADSTNGILLSL
jgi:hypothetical protein